MVHVSQFFYATMGSRCARAAMFGALAEHTFRSAKTPTGAAEAAALPDARWSIGAFSTPPLHHSITPILHQFESPIPTGVSVSESPHRYHQLPSTSSVVAFR